MLKDIRAYATDKLFIHRERIVILIKKLALAIDKQALAILNPINLAPSQYKTVKYLIKRENEPVRQVDIERYYSMRRDTG